MSENKVASIFKGIMYFTAVIGGLGAVLWGSIAHSWVVFLIFGLCVAASCISLYAVGEHFSLLQQSVDTQNAILSQLEKMAKESKETAPTSLIQDIEDNLPQI